MDEISVNLHERYLGGDTDAARQIFERYLGRLIGLARTRMSERLLQRVDAEDVVQSVFRSFFVKARDGRFDIEKAGDLWRLLAGITVNKVLKQAEHHRQQKRALDREQAAGAGTDESAIMACMVAREPTPDDALALLEEMEAVTSRLKPHEREMLELRLQGREAGEIAIAVNRSERTVRRLLERVRSELELRLLAVANPPPPAGSGPVPVDSHVEDQDGTRRHA